MTGRDPPGCVQEGLTWGAGGVQGRSPAMYIPKEFCKFFSFFVDQWNTQCVRQALCIQHKLFYNSFLFCVYLGSLAARASRAVVGARPGTGTRWAVVIVRPVWGLGQNPITPRIGIRHSNTKLAKGIRVKGGGAGQDSTSHAASHRRHFGLS